MFYHSGTRGSKLASFQDNVWELLVTAKVQIFLLYLEHTHFRAKRTREEAEGQGWVLLTSCTEMFLGHRFANPADDSIVLIFDDAGFIAGSQSVIPASVADAGVMAGNPAYQVERQLHLQQLIKTFLARQMA